MNMESNTPLPVYSTPSVKGCGRVGLFYALWMHTHGTYAFMSAILMRGPNPLLTLLNHRFTLRTHTRLSLLPSLEALIVLSPPPHFEVKGSSGGSLLVPGERRRAEYSVSGTSGRAPLSRAYLAGGWYWHRQPSYRGPFISVWTCGLGPNPGRSLQGSPPAERLRRGRSEEESGSPAVLRSSAEHSCFPPRLPIHVHVSPHLRLACCQTLIRLEHRYGFFKEAHAPVRGTNHQQIQFFLG